MVIAQETIKWGGEFSHHNNYKPIDLRCFEVNEYEDILHELQYPDVILRKLECPNDILRALMLLYDERVNKEWGLGGLLWTFYVNLRCELEKNAPYKFGLIHNNIAKIANKSGEKVNGARSICSLNTPLIEMIKDEISITNPNVVVCCTGNDSHYQELLVHLNPEICKLVKTLSPSRVITSLHDVKIGGISRKVVCCYHPRYLNYEKGGIRTTTDKIISMLYKAYNVSIDS